MKTTQIPTESGRLVTAVASMGYDPDVALCDLLDNSIDAGATQISLLVSSTEETKGQRIGEYVITDNGTGMDEEGLVHAFTLGADRDYAHGSLGKFGLGLKSAGLSLGSEVVLLSKTETSDLKCAILDLNAVQKSGTYEIELGIPPAEFVGRWEELAGDRPSGTVLLIRRTVAGSPTESRFADYLGRLLGCVYHVFMEQKGLQISVNDSPVEAFDPLFLKEAASNKLSPETWDGLSPCVLLEPQNLPLQGLANCEVAITHLVHPNSFGIHAKTKTSTEFEEAATQARGKWRINPEQYNRRYRHGFYVYRNERMISWGDRFWGMIGPREQFYAFRGSLKFDETADDVLCLDVKKRRIELPIAAREHLKDLVELRKNMSKNAWEARGRVAQAYKRSIAGSKDENLTQSPIASTPATDLSHNYSGAEPGDELALEVIKQLQIELSNDSAQAIQDPNLTGEKLDDLAEVGEVVVPAQGLRANRLWIPYPSIKLNRVETVVNMSHTWVSKVYQLAEEDPRLRLILNQLFTALARAELDVRTGSWKDLSASDSQKVMDRFHRSASYVAEDLAEAFSEAVEKLEATAETDGDEELD